MIVKKYVLTTGFITVSRIRNSEPEGPKRKIHFFFFVDRRTPKEAGGFNESERVYNNNIMHIYFNIYKRVHHHGRRLGKKKMELIATINGNNNNNVCLYVLYRSVYI